MQNPSKHSVKKEVLVVDDTPDNLRLLSAILTKKNYEVRKALSSQQAIASVHADAPDLILLDIKMPEVDGYETCQVLKANPVTEAIPIIFISALDDVLDKVRAFAVGGVDYITKPFQEAEVLARIENQLSLRALQRQLEVQNKALLRSNQELEQFAHIVSHDLQQPLQSIMGYTRIIDLQYSQLFDTTTKQYLTNIVKASDRMQRLIKDLLAYAKVTQEQVSLSPVDCKLILSQVLSNLEAALETHQVEFSCSELPIVLGSEVQLIQLFQNLIDNAIKFSRPDVKSRITVTAKEINDSTWLFEVHDNGVGIPAEKVKSIFDRFQRLHSHEKYPGTGIGLNICQRIVEHHGGEIWVESALGKGSSFYFKLPSVHFLNANPTTLSHV